MKGRGRSSCRLSSTGHLCVVEKAIALLLRSVLGGGRFDTVVLVPLRRVRLAGHGFTWAGLMTRGVVGRIEALVLDKL
jgi:hypothetical protein